MNIRTEKKVEVFKYALKRIQKDFNILPMLEYADQQYSGIKDLKEIQIK